MSVFDGDRAGPWVQPPDGVILDALEGDLKQWYLREAERDVEGMLHFARRLAMRRTEVDVLHDGGAYLKAHADLLPVEVRSRSLVAPGLVPVVPVPVLTPGWDDETHWQRWWPTYLTVIAVSAAVMVVLWVVVALVNALVAALIALVPVLLGVLGALLLVVVLSGLGGGGKGFTFSGSGRLH